MLKVASRVFQKLSNFDFFLLKDSLHVRFYSQILQSGPDVKKLNFVIS